MRNLMVNGLNEIPGFHCHQPDGCYVAFANIEGTGMSSGAMQKILLEEAKVAIVPGLTQWFGSEAKNHIRLTFCTSEVLITEALSRITNTISKI
jgi:aspartate/methionine/tyrosine aminotransferase